MNWKRIFTAFVCVTTLSAFGCDDDDNDIDIDEINNDEVIINNDFVNNDFLNNDFLNNDEFNEDEDFLGDPAGDPPGDPLTLDQFEQQLTLAMTQHFCQSAFECPEIQPWPFILSVAGRFGDLETCLENYNPGFTAGLLETERRLIANGTLVYDETQAAACLNDMLGGLEACSDFTTGFVFDDSGVCSQVFIAQLADGEACVDDLECTSQYCVAGDDVCGGVCGTPIELAEENTSCAVATCDDGLICVFDGSADINGLICVQPRTLERDEWCYGFSERCVEGLVCGLEGTCTDPPTFVGNGETCNQVNTFCNPGLACHGINPDDLSSTGTCGALHRLGESCQVSDQCIFGLYCDSTVPEAGTCQTQLLLGESCVGVIGDECAFGLYCNQELDVAVCETRIVADGACFLPAE